MIDPSVLRENPDLVRHSQRLRGASPDLVDSAIDADRVRREAIGRFEELRAEQNAFGKRVAQASKEDKPALLAQVKDLAAAVKAAQQEAA
ncbi:MAG: serine--tRNA ligase, partial [Mycetocola reblochoni]